MRRSTWSRPAPPTTCPKPWNDERLLATVTNLVELGQANRALASAWARAPRAARAGTEYDLRGLVWADPATERVLSWPARWRAPTCRS
jgi:hypothetical protein